MLQLAFLKKQYAHLPAQGTEAWRQSRRTKIGGSEMAAAIGESPYLNLPQLITRKQEKRFQKSAACTFGRIFEDVAKAHIEKTHGVKIHELGAIPSSRYPVCYSPDGVIVQDDKLVLVEIKCPFQRNKIKTVPAHYLCQVQTGMSVLPCETTNFYQYRFRCCKLGDLGNSVRYNRWMHLESRKRCPDRKPLAFGFLHWEDDTELIDLGDLGGENTKKLCFVDGRKCTIHHGDDDLPTEGYILPWKLFDHSLVEVERDQHFLDRHQDTLWRAFAELCA